MENLARHLPTDDAESKSRIITDVTRTTLTELERCGIRIVRHTTPVNNSEVPTTGVLGPFTFERAWYYWRMHGPVPEAMALAMYDHPVGKTDIRVNGHCGCPAPGEPGGALTYRNVDGKILVTQQEWDEMLEFSARHSFMWTAMLNEYRPSAHVHEEGRGFIEDYHIDTELGLYVFAEHARQLIATAR